MEKIFQLVDVSHPTWLLYISLLVIAVYFRFSRLVTVRNFDVLLLLLISTTLVIDGKWQASAESGDSRQSSAKERSGDDNRVPDADEAAASSSSDPSIAAADGDASVKPVDENDEDDETTVAELAADESDDAAVGNDAAPKHRWSSFVLLAFSIILICRLTLDEALTRRPRLEQNLNQAGLTFLCVPSFIILMISVLLQPPPGANVAVAKSGQALLHAREAGANDVPGESATTGATTTMLAAGATGVAEISEKIASKTESPAGQQGAVEVWVARVLVVLAHSLVIIGLMYIGRRHFSSTQLGVSMVCLYLLLPCTAYRVHDFEQVLPAACLTWAFASYRRPAVAGVLLGLACGTLFFAVFLLPLWAVFYGRKGSVRFGLSLAGVAAAVLITFALTSSDTDSFMNKVVTSINWTVFRIFEDAMPATDSAIGQVFLRITLASVFFVMLTAMTVIPRKRNLENLLANSTALVVTAQLWYPEEVGSYVLWYLPLLLLVMFRPRLDRFVPPEISEGHKSVLPVDQTAAAKSGGTLPRITLFS
ncbi:MAG: hypothetical protein R3C19_23695 [Planctomycetaceae bacterium]